ncbi:MAG: ATP-binding cassette domain-containing protein [Patescibacteria group bacterium]|jgi:Fe-S cluster assembly ATP-binding protein|nr:ATP-binding cassette domain-containing protein [Patescibacteria group bacterium]
MLKIKDLSVVSKTTGEKLLSNINLEVGEREIHSLLGKKGSGKTTLAKVILGLGEFNIEAEKIEYGKENILNLSTNERAIKGKTMAFQEPARFEGLTVRDFLLAGNSSAGNNEMKRVLELVDLNDGNILDRKLDEKLSGGERKRIELASVIIMKPKLMILDEPDASLDIIVYNELYDMLTKIREEIRCSILLITHREEAGLISDKATFLNDGTVIETGTFRHVMRKYCEIMGRRGRCLAGRNLKGKI